MKNEIKATDLRIYNRVLCRGKLSVVTSIDQLTISYLSSHGRGERRIPLRLVKPIPITEEGLDKIKMCDLEKLRNYSSLVAKYLGCVKIVLKSKRDAKFIHELQNAYFLLEETELSINNI